MDVLEMVEAAGHPAFATDGRGLTVACNRAAESFLGVGRERILGRALHELVPTWDANGNPFGAGASLDELTLRGEPIPALELHVRDAAGALVRVEVGLAIVCQQPPARDRFVYRLRPLPRRRRVDKLIDLLLDGRDDPAPPSGAASLSRREQQILQRLAAGESTGEISRSLGVSSNTVRSHVKTLLRKLEVHSRAEAVALALRLRLL